MGLPEEMVRALLTASVPGPGDSPEGSGKGFTLRLGIPNICVPCSWTPCRVLGRGPVPVNIPWAFFPCCAYGGFM